MREGLVMTRRNLLFTTALSITGSEAQCEEKSRRNSWKAENTYPELPELSASE
jgi:hypothetical protein